MRKVTSHILAISFLILFTEGCKMGPNYQGVTVQAPDTYYFSERSDSLGDLKWWELFDDPVLDSLITLALINNQNILIATQNVAQSRSILNIQKAEMYPKIGLQANGTYGNFNGFRGDDPAGAYSAGVNLKWEIDFWGKIRRLKESALAEYLASQYGLRALKLSIITEVAVAYLQLLEFKSRVDISIRTLALRDSSLALIQSRYDAGIVPEIDLNQAQIQRAIAASSIPFFKRSEAQIENALSILVGANPQRITAGLTLDSQTIIPDIPPGIPSDILARRPDIAQAEQFVISQNALIGAAEAARFPTISLTGLLGGASNELAGVTSAGLAYSVGGSITGPLLNWGQNKRRVEIERSLTESATINYELTALNAFREVEDALVEIQTYKEELVARREHVRAALNGQILSSERYDKGVTSYLEYLESQRQAFEAQLELATVQQELLSSYVRLYKALGGGWLTEDEINNPSLIDEG